jgi:hypothetical protein
MKRFFSSMRVNAAVVSGLLVLAVLFSACSKLDNGDNDNNQAAGVMAFNLAPDVASATITLSGNTVTTNPLGYGSFTGTYLGVFPGVRPVEAFNYNTGNSIASATSFTFDVDKYYSIFLVGANNTYRTVIVNDLFDSLSNAGQAYIRYINAVPDSSHPTVTIASGGTNVVNTNAAFASVSEFTAVNPGDVTIAITNGGTISANRTITVEARKVYTVLLQGIPGSTGNDSVQVKYILNGTLDAEAGRAASAAGRAAN